MLVFIINGNSLVSIPTPRLSRRMTWRSILLLLVLILGVLSINALYNSLVNAQTVLSGANGEVLYAAGFDGFEDEWQQYDGRLKSQIADGVLRLTVDDTNSTIYSLAKPAFGDFDMQVQVSPVDGPIDNAYGVIFRLHKQANTCDMPLKALCDLAEIDLFAVPLRLMFRPTSNTADGYYIFLISADGYYSVWKASETGSTTQAKKVSQWIASDLVRQGLDEKNTLRVVAQGDTFQFYINGEQVALCLPDNPDSASTYSGGECIGGQMVFGLTDADYATGQIGMVAQSTVSGGTGVVVEYDNLIITSPAPDAGLQA